MNLNYIIAFLVIAFFAIIFGAYFLSRLKGKINIKLDKYEFNPGEKIQGTIILKINKPLKSKELSVGLLCELSQKKFNVSFNKTSNQSHEKLELFNFTKPISKSQNYMPGEYKYDFEIIIPKDANSKEIKKLPFGFNSEESSQSFFSLHLGPNSGIKKWYVTATLDIKGFNIYNQISINVI